MKKTKNLILTNDKVDEIKKEAEKNNENTIKICNELQCRYENISKNMGNVSKILKRVF